MEANIHQQMELSVLLFHTASLQDCICLHLVSKWDHGQTFQVASISEFQALEEEKEKKEKTKEQKLIVASPKMEDKKNGEGIGKQTSSRIIRDMSADLGHAKVDQDQSSPI